MFDLKSKRLLKLIFLLVSQAALLCSCASSEINDEYYREQMYLTTDASLARARAQKNENEYVQTEKLKDKSKSIKVENKIDIQQKIETKKESANAKLTQHIMVQDETLWFLATLYYGNGAQYKKIISANHLSENEIGPGAVLNIPNPKFTNKMSGFKSRYVKLNKIRLAALKTKKGSQNIASRNIGLDRQIKKRVPADAIQD
jgi:LysM repeat protein